MVKKTNGISDQVKKELFAKAYLSNGFKSAEAAEVLGYKKGSSCAQASNKMLHDPVVKELINAKKDELSNKFDMTMEWKLGKLKQCIEESMQLSQYNVAISAISEANKMQGHHSGEKVFNLNMNIDIESEDVKRLNKLYERDY